MTRTLQYVLGVLFYAFCTLGIAQDVKSYIPENCRKISPVVLKENKTYMGFYKSPWYFGALIEHESCLSLTHKRCCSQNSTLDTKREFGAGVGMITKAYNADGSVRFDALKDLRARYFQELKELSWSNVLQRLDLQIRAVILLSKSNYSRFSFAKGELERTRMMDSAYNGGANSVIKAATACGMAKDCDPGIWFKNVESYISKSRKPLYAGRSALDINLEHVVDVTVTRYKKYEKLYTE